MCLVTSKDKLIVTWCSPHKCVKPHTEMCSHMCKRHCCPETQRPPTWYTGKCHFKLSLSVSAFTNSRYFKCAKEDHTMAFAGHAVAFSLRFKLSMPWVFTVISNALTCTWISVWIVLGPRFGFKWNFNDRIMTERETSMTHSHRSITLNALHHTAITSFASEGSHKLLVCLTSHQLTSCQGIRYW